MGESGESVTFSPNHKAPLDWSYKSRKTKKFLKFDPNQSLLTDYFSIVKEIDEAVCNNPSLSGLIKENCQNSNTIEFSTLVLQQLFTNAYKNSQREKGITR